MEIDRGDQNFTHTHTHTHTHIQTHTHTPAAHFISLFFFKKETRLKSKRISWLGHVIRMEENRIEKKLFNGKPGGRRRIGRPRLRWLDDAEEDLRKMKVRRWRTKAKDT